MLLSESYKNRLKKLAGLLNEDLYDFSEEEKNLAFKDFNQRVPFSKDLMTKAIKQGWEVGLLFQSNNKKYKMPVAKTRVIYPVAMGTNANGNLLIRALHKLGQSESGAKKAQKIGKKNFRSAEVKNEWRLFAAKNIKGMWLTGNFFNIDDSALSQYKETGDKSFKTEIQAKKSLVRKFQKDYNLQRQKEQEKPVQSLIVPTPPKKNVIKEPEKIKTKNKETEKPKIVKEPIKPIKPISTNNQQK